MTLFFFVFFSVWLLISDQILQPQLDMYEINLGEVIAILKTSKDVNAVFVQILIMYCVNSQK